MNKYKECPVCGAKVSQPINKKVIHFECRSYILLKKTHKLIQTDKCKLNAKNKNTEHYVAIKNRSDGNESVGSMWEETLVVDENTTVKEIMQWAMMMEDLKGTHSKIKVVLTKAHTEVYKKDIDPNLPF